MATTSVMSWVKSVSRRAHIESTHLLIVSCAPHRVTGVWIARDRVAMGRPCRLAPRNAVVRAPLLLGAPLPYMWVPDLGLSLRARPV
jgi:hypothetical protein|eukprot:2504187-Prymnesium_polylepis.2